MCCLVNSPLEIISMWQTPLIVYPVSTLPLLYLTSRMLALRYTQIKYLFFQLALKHKNGYGIELWTMRYRYKSAKDLCMISAFVFFFFFFQFISVSLPSCCCSVAKSGPTLCNPMGCSMPSFPVLHCLLDFAQIHVHWVSDTIQPPRSLTPPSPPALNPSKHQVFSQWVISSYQMTEVLELQLQHQSFQWIFRTDFL